MAKNNDQAVVVEKSPKFDRVKGYFDGGHWTIEMVTNAVKKSWITAGEYKEITGEEYDG